MKGYRKDWYRSSNGRYLFNGVESNKVKKVFPLSRHLNCLYYGLGDSLSNTMSWPMSVNTSVSFNELGSSQLIRFNIIYSRRSMMFGFKLKEFEKTNYKRLFKIRCRRGVRLLLGLPVRGQTSHTNAISAYSVGKVRRKEVFSGKEKLKGTRAERKARYHALQERKKALKLRASKKKVKALLREVKRKKKVKERERAWIMSKQKAQMERARKKWQSVSAKKKQQRMRRWYSTSVSKFTEVINDTGILKVERFYYYNTSFDKNKVYNNIHKDTIFYKRNYTTSIVDNGKDNNNEHHKYISSAEFKNKNTNKNLHTLVGSSNISILNKEGIALYIY